jgi:hypothetical protein
METYILPLKQKFRIFSSVGYLQLDDFVSNSYIGSL